MPDIFISYSRRDKDFVARLNQALNARGKDAWVDWEDIPASAEWLREIQDGIDSTDAFLFVLSPDSVRSEVCAQELDHALERRKRILPVLHRDVDPKSVRAEAAAINWVYLRDQDAFEAGLETLVRALDTDLDYVKAHTRLSNQALSWDRSGRDRARLLRGSELEAAERWLTQAAAKQPAATELQAQFVQASRLAARRRGRVIFGGVAFALLVAVVLAIVALIQRSDAIRASHVAFARELDANAVGQYNTDPELSVLLATKAAQVASGTQTREALRSALARSHVRYRYTNPSGQSVGEALWSPAGDRLLMAENGARRAEIVVPGQRAKPLILPAPGLDGQIGWDASGKRAVTGGSFIAIWNPDTGALVRRIAARGLAVALSPDGRRVAGADLNHHVVIFDVASGRLLATATLPNAAIPNCVRFSPDGSVLAACVLYGVTPGKVVRSSNQIQGGLVLLDPATGRLLHSIGLPGPVPSAAFSPDSRRVAVASNGAGIQTTGTRVYDVHSGATQLSFPGAASAVAFSPDGKELAYATLQGNIAYVYTFAGGNRQPLVGNAGTINSIAFSPDGAYVITGSGDRTARVFEYLTGKPVEVLAGHSDAVTDATMTRDDTLLATASLDGTARVWEGTAPRPVRRLTLGRRPLSSLSFAPGGKRLAVVGLDSSGLILDGLTLRRLAAIAAPGGDGFLGAAWSPDGRWLATLAGRVGAGGTPAPGGAYVYDPQSGARAASVAGPSPIFYAAIDGQGHLATAAANGQVSLWDASTGRLERTLLASGPPIQNMGFDDGGGRLAVAHATGTIDVFDPAAGRRLITIKGPPPQPQIVDTQFTLPVIIALSRDGKLLASAGADKYVYVWDVASGRQLRRLPGGYFVSLAFSHDDRRLAAGSGSSAFVWEMPSGVLLREFQHADASTYGTLIVNRLEGVRVGWSADDQTLATTGDFAVRAWNVASGESLFDSFSSLGDMTLDGSYLAGAQGGSVRVYRCDLCGGVQQLLAAAGRNTTRTLTPGERALYLHQS